METGLRDASEEAFVDGRWRPTRAWGEDPAVADGAVQRVLVLGDIHNSDGVLHTALNIAERERCDAVVSVGDFWLQDCSWDTRPRTHMEGSPSLSWSPLMRLAMRAPVPVIVIDGNHEVWPCLADYGERTEPHLVLHGHWHQTNHEHIRDGNTEVFGLNRDGNAGCIAVLDLDDPSGAYCTPGRDQFRGKRHPATSSCDS